MQDLFTSINPAEAAIIATVFSALLILAIILSVRAYFYQAHAKQQAEQLADSYKSIKDAIDENLRLKTEYESLTTRNENLWMVNQTLNAELHDLKNLNKIADNHITNLEEQRLERSKFYLDCKQFVDQNNLVENSAQRSDNVVIEALQTLAGQVINSDKEIGRIRAEFEKYGAKFKTVRNTHGQVAEKLATMHRKTTDLVMAASRIPRVGQVPREAFANLMKCAADCATIKKVNDGIREEGVCA